MSKGTYVAYKVLNHNELRDWYNKQNLTVTEEELHVTVAYSRKQFESKLDKTVIISVNPLFFKGHQLFGDSLVLEFSNAKLTSLFNNYISNGATYDYEEYRSHVTLTSLEEQENLDLTQLTPPNFPILLGSIYSEELQFDED